MNSNVNLKGADHPATKYKYIATNIKNPKQVIEVIGRAEIERLGFTYQLVSMVVLGKRKKHGGYQWERIAL